MITVNMKSVEITIVQPVKGQPGKRLGTLMRRVPEEMTLPEIIQDVRKELKDETEGVIFLDNGSFNQTLADWKLKHEKAA